MKGEERERQCTFGWGTGFYLERFDAQLGVYGKRGEAGKKGLGGRASILGNWLLVVRQTRDQKKISRLPLLEIFHLVGELAATGGETLSAREG